MYAKQDQGPNNTLLGTWLPFSKLSIKSLECEVFVKSTFSTSKQAAIIIAALSAAKILTRIGLL
jgi:hypothetical protein